MTSPKKKPAEFKLIDKVKDTSSFLWSLRLAYIVIIGASVGGIAKAKDLIGYMAKDTIKEEVAKAKQEISEDVEDQFENLLSLMVESFPEFRKAAEEKAKKEKNNDTLLKAIKK